MICTIARQSIFPILWSFVIHTFLLQWASRLQACLLPDRIIEEELTGILKGIQHFSLRKVCQWQSPDRLEKDYIVCYTEIRGQKCFCSMVYFWNLKSYRNPRCSTGQSALDSPLWPPSSPTLTTASSPLDTPTSQSTRKSTVPTGQSILK